MEENVIIWFPDIKKKVTRYIDNCLKCIEFTVPSGKKGFLTSLEKEDKPFLTDYLGPLEKTGKKINSF